MNKLMKMRLWASVLLLSMVISIPTVKVSALTEKTKTTDGTEEIKTSEETETTEETINQDENQIKIIPESKLPLYNMEDEVIAYYYRLETGGYAIANTEDGIIEFHFTDDIYNLTKEDKFYYTAPLECYEDVGNKKVKHRFDKKIRRKKDIILQRNGASDYTDPDLEWVDQFACMIKASELGGYTTVEKGGIKESTDSYKNPVGNDFCGSIAAGILFRYYDQYESTKYLPNGCDSQDEVLKLLVPYINAIVGGADIALLKDGMERYLIKQGLSNKKVKYLVGRNSTTVYNKIKEYTKTKIVH